MQESSGSTPVVVGRRFGQKALERRLRELVLAAWRLQAHCRPLQTVHTTTPSP